jgi:hypothetical protein
MHIQLLVQREDAGDTPDVVGKILRLVAGEGAAEEGGLAVAEPLFENLVAAEGVGPDRFGNAFPASGGVEVHVEVAVAVGAGSGLAGAENCDAVPARDSSDVGLSRTTIFFLVHNGNAAQMLESIITLRHGIPPPTL